MLAGLFTQSGWGGLAGVTLVVSYRLLSLYEADVRVDYSTRLLGVGDFDVYIPMKAVRATKELGS